MSHLIAVAYPDLRTAENARRALLRLTVERVVEIEDSAIIVSAAKGRLTLHQGGGPARRGTVPAGTGGGLIGLLLLLQRLQPGRPDDVDPRFLRRLGGVLAPGGAALLVLVRRCTPDALLPQLRDFGGTPLQTLLSAEAELRLRDALRMAARTGAER